LILGLFQKFVIGNMPFFITCILKVDFFKNLAFFRNILKIVTYRAPPFYGGAKWATSYYIFFVSQKILLYHQWRSAVFLCNRKDKDQHHYSGGGGGVTPLK